MIQKPNLVLRRQLRHTRCSRIQKKRQAYDQFGFAGLQGGENAHDFSNVFNDFDDIFGNFSSMFDFFGGRGSSRRSSRSARGMQGEDVELVLTIDFKTLILGGDVELEYKRKRLCDSCSGRGHEQGSSEMTCPNCGGAGQVRRSSGLFSIATVCSHCGGSGSVIKDHCRDCGGVGREDERIQRHISIPAGIDDGNYLTIRGAGSEGRDGSVGDVNILLQVIPHPYFERIDNDLHCTIPITISQAVLGSDIYVTTLDEKSLKVKIPAGSQNGKILRIKGEGVPHRGMVSRKGDMYVTLHVSIPDKVNSNQERELYRSLSQFEPENNRPTPIKRS